jgi:hypothetical protein
MVFQNHALGWAACSTPYIPFEAPADIERQLADLARELDTERVRTQSHWTRPAKQPKAATWSSGSSRHTCTCSIRPPATP